MNKRKILIILAVLTAVLLVLCCILLLLPEENVSGESLPSTGTMGSTGATVPSTEETTPKQETSKPIVITPEPSSGVSTQATWPKEPDDFGEPDNGSGSDTVIGTEIRDITTGYLTAAEKETIAKLTAEACGNKYRNLRNFAKWAYEAANVQVYGNVDLTVAQMYLKLFVKDSSGKYTANTELSGYTLMLVPGYYGGSKAATTRTFTAEDFQVGDLFAATSANTCEHGKNIYTVGIYQGDGRFLVMEDNCETCANKSYTDTGTFFRGETALESFFSYFYVLRPERLAGAVTISHTAVELDLFSKNTEELTAVYAAVDSEGAISTEEVTWSSSNEAVATVVNGRVTSVGEGECVITAAYGSQSVECKVVVTNTAPVIRDICTQKLTDAEKQAIAALSKLTSGQNLKSAAAEIYGAANIDITGVIDQNIAGMIASKLLKRNSDDLFAPKSDLNKYTLMLVPDYYGGEQAAANKLFTADDFEIGDLFIGYRKCTVHTDKYRYTTAVYQGNGKFLAVDCNCDCACSYTFTIGDEPTDMHGEGNEWFLYCVLRPDRLAGALVLQENELELDTSGSNAAELSAKYVYLDSSGTVTAEDVEVSLVSSDPTVVTVEGSTVSSVGEGTAVITATYTADQAVYTATCTVVVQN